MKKNKTEFEEFILQTKGRERERVILDDVHRDRSNLADCCDRQSDAIEDIGHKNRKGMRKKGGGGLHEECRGEVRHDHSTPRRQR